MSESRFIGRRADLDDIQQQLYHCLSGQPRILLVEGLAGMGKTRFLEEVRTMAQQQGMDVYSGACDETLIAPYEPFAGLLPRLDDEAVLGTREITLLHRLFGGAAQTQPMPTLDVRKQDTIEFRMAVTRALIRLAEDQPLLVIVDNLHAADQPSLDLFDYLAFTLAEQRTAPVLLVASHRPVTPNTEVGRLLSRLQREDVVRRLELSGLEEPETRQLLQLQGVTRPTQQLVQAIHNVTQGIPLFIQEAVHHALRTGALHTQGGYLAVRPDAVATLRLPRDIFDTIAGRINALPASCQAILTVASLLGDGFQADELALLEPNYEAALDVATQQGMLRREGERYQFVHTLIRRAFVSRLRLEQRRRLHLDIARALDRHYGEHSSSHALEIAHHLLESGSLVDRPTLLSYAREAGDQAFNRFAWGDAARYYEAALSALGTASGRATLHHQAALSYYHNQDVGPALDHFERARAAYEVSGNRSGLAQSLMWLVRLRLMHATVPMGVLPPNVEALEAVLAMLDDADLTLQGHIMTVLSQAYRHAREAVRGTDLAQAALDIGRRLGDDRLCAQAGQSLGLAHLSRLQVESAAASWQDSLRFARAADDLMLQRLALTNLPNALNLQGNLEEGTAMALEGVELTQTLQDWGERSKAFSHLASIAAARGSFGLVEQYAHEAMLMVERSHYPWGGLRALGALAYALAARGMWDEANHALDTLIEPGRVFASPGRIQLVFTRVLRQLILAYQNRYLEENVVSLCDDLMAVATYDTYSLAPLCAMIELGWFTLIPSVVERPAAMLEVALEEGVVFSSGWSFLIPRVLGVAAMMLDEWEQAEAHFQHALTIATYAGTQPELGRTYLDYAYWVRDNPEIEDVTPVYDHLRQARRILYQQNMIPHARLASESLKKLFPQEPPDPGDIHGNGEDPPQPPTNGDH
ncbi:ATP-binding protein [Candidatus Entotheonella palauensis]|uniref:ATP-binding protein n=1 Tax=Candidatus Entotheonella palauensis TaxID=93172 RepID=UPI0015C42283|nr:AAA family ATPase [Candidatus Entotheonella palauensis]